MPAPECLPLPLSRLLGDQLCGIVGFTHTTRVLRPSCIRNAVQSLIHRGPDQQGVYETEDISLGAVRLIIVDRVHGNQPMISEDGDIVLVFNGELYNHAEIRRQLIRVGSHFRSSSDTEVVLEAFREWDMDCFRRFRGMFAVGIWVNSQKRLVLARDRIGIKPLFFYQCGKDLFFASEIKALFQHPDMDLRINVDALNCYLRLNYVPGPQSMVDGVEKLRPGHIFEWSNGRTALRSYWTLPSSPPLRWDLEDAKAELHTLLKQSVREHLTCDVPVGIWASGGLDSSTVVHYAAESGMRPKTFSITFHGHHCDESEFIREVSQRYGTDHSSFDLNTDLDLASAIEQFAYYSDDPCADAGALPVWFLSKLSRKDVTVALSGEGADELFGGYITYLADRYRRWAQALPLSIRRAAFSVARRWPVSDEKIGFEYKLKRFWYGSMLSPEDAHVFWNGAFSEHEKKEILFPSDAAPLRTLLQEMPGASGLNRYLQFDLRCYLPDNILCKIDRMSMAHSLEVRPPFLDHRICEFAFSLPEQLKIRQSRLKFVLRELMATKLPRSILNRRKVGFDIPAHAWLRGALKPLLLDTVTKAAVEESGLFCWPGIQSILTDHLERRRNWGYHLWGLMIFLLWARRWKVFAGSSLSSSPQPSFSDASTVFRT
jgi:asparagine synthase (glutamine-hydrolysing)